MTSVVGGLQVVLVYVPAAAFMLDDHMIAPQANSSSCRSAAESSAAP